MSLLIYFLSLHFKKSQFHQSFKSKKSLHTYPIFTCLFWRKSLAIMIARLLSLLLLSCKHFNVAHYSKSGLGINIKLGILALHDKMQLQKRGITLKGVVLELCPIFNLNFQVEWCPQQTRVGTTCGALV